jgi:hypothetical protein
MLEETSFDISRIRLIMSRYSEKNKWSAKPDSQVNFRLSEATLNQLNYSMRQRIYYSTDLEIKIDGMITASAHYHLLSYGGHFFGEHYKAGDWSLSPSIAWLWTDEDVPFSEVRRDGNGPRVYQHTFENLDSLVNYIVRRAAKADCQAFWPMVSYKKGWQLSTMFHREREPFLTADDAKSFLWAHEDAIYEDALQASRLSPGEQYLK